MYQVVYFSYILLVRTQDSRQSVRLGEKIGVWLKASAKGSLVPPKEGCRSDVDLLSRSLVLELVHVRVGDPMQCPWRHRGGTHFIHGST